MIFRSICYYGRNDRFFNPIYLPTFREISSMIGPQVKNISQPIFTLYYFVERLDNPGQAIMQQMVVQRQPGKSEEQLIKELTIKIIKICRASNLKFHLW